MTQPTTTRGDLTTGPVSGHIRAIAVPASVGLFFHTMFNVVDTWIAGRLSTDALAALSLSFPAFFVIIALGSGLSTGATALVANALGRKDPEAARELASQTMVFALLLSALLAAAGLAVAPAMFRLLGAEEAYLDTALAYMNVIFAGSGLFIFGLLLQRPAQRRGRHAQLPQLPDSGMPGQYHPRPVVRVRRPGPAEAWHRGHSLGHPDRGVLRGGLSHAPGGGRGACCGRTERGISCPGPGSWATWPGRGFRPP